MQTGREEANIIQILYIACYIEIKYQLLPNEMRLQFLVDHKWVRGRRAKKKMLFELIKKLIKVYKEICFEGVEMDKVAGSCC